MDFITSTCHKCKGSGDRLIKRHTYFIADIGTCLTCMGSGQINYKKLSEVEMLSIRRLRSKNKPYSDIADRFSVSVETILANLNSSVAK